MKAYTLRLEDHMWTQIKETCLKEKKSLKRFIFEALEEKFFKEASKSEDLKRKKLFQDAARLSRRLTTEQVVASIREDRDR